MKDIIFIKAYVDLNDKELSQDKLYDGYRGIWRISKDKVKDLKYAFAIHNNIIKNVYLIDKWHNANTTPYKSREINTDDPKLKNRLEFTGKPALNMQYLIDKDIDKENLIL